MLLVQYVANGGFMKRQTLLVGTLQRTRMLLIIRIALHILNQSSLAIIDIHKRKEACVVLFFNSFPSSWPFTL